MKLAADVEVSNKMSIWTVCSVVSMVTALFDDLKERKIRVVPLVLCLGIGLMQTGARHVRDGDLDLVIIRGTVCDLQLEFRDHPGKGNRVGFCHIAASCVSE